MKQLSQSCFFIGGCIPQDEVYCVYPTEDYLQDLVVFRYSKVLKEPSSLACLVGKTFTKVCQQYGGIHFETDTTTATLDNLYLPSSSSLVRFNNVLAENPGSPADLPPPVPLLERTPI